MEFLLVVPAPGHDPASEASRYCPDPRASPALRHGPGLGTAQADHESGADRCAATFGSAVRRPPGQLCEPPSATPASAASRSVSTDHHCPIRASRNDAAATVSLSAASHAAA